MLNWPFYLKSLMDLLQHKKESTRYVSYFQILLSGTNAAWKATLTVHSIVTRSLINRYIDISVCKIKA